VGSALVSGSLHFTAEVVKVEGRELAKAGRRFRPDPRLQRVD
jgi:nicotinate phosphoribosyltransferase